MPLSRVPQDLAAALRAAGLTAYFAECTAAHRREYLQWIEAARRPGTRPARIAKSVEMLTARQVAEASRAK